MHQVVSEPISAYLGALHGPVDDVLEAIGREGRDEGLPLVDAASARLLRTLAIAAGARRILEIGTAIGYSALWLAGALPAGGQLISMEIDAGRAARARENFERAGLSDRVSVVVGDASRFLHKVSGPFDLVFQDGAKALYEPLLDRLVGLLRPGGVLVCDNVLWSGRVLDDAEEPPDDETRALRAYNRRLAADARLLTTFVPVGDGLSISVKLPER
jgi:caffeoyl-CoA O-methyltransferase